MSHTNHSDFSMARPLHISAPPFSTSQTGLGLAAVSLLLSAFALLACASHSRKWRRWRACYEFLELEDEPVIELNNEVIGTEFQEYQLGNGDQSMFSGEQQGVSIWQKNILMGGKCQLPDFSGVIMYDSEGNVITPAKPPCPLLTWK